MLKNSTRQKRPLAEGARARVGRPSSYKPEYAKMAFHLCKLGATDADLADAFGVSVVTIDNWKIKYPEFLGSLKTGKEETDNRVEKSLAQRAIGYSHPAVKAFMTRDGKIVEHKYVEHYPPDPASMCFWLKNRRPDRWRDVQRIDAAMGHYVLSDRPMTEEEWIRERTIADGGETIEHEPD
jgi:hypothetical protein